MRGGSGRGGGVVGVVCVDWSLDYYSYFVVAQRNMMLFCSVMCQRKGGGKGGACACARGSS